MPSSQRLALWKIITDPPTLKVSHLPKTDLLFPIASFFVDYESWIKRWFPFFVIAMVVNEMYLPCNERTYKSEKVFRGAESNELLVAIAGVSHALSD